MPGSFSFNRRATTVSDAIERLLAFPGGTLAMLDRLPAMDAERSRSSGGNLDARLAIVSEASTNSRASVASTASLAASPALAAALPPTPKKRSAHINAMLMASSMICSVLHSSSAFSKSCPALRMLSPVLLTPVEAACIPASAVIRVATPAPEPQRSSDPWDCRHLPAGSGADRPLPLEPPALPPRRPPAPKYSWSRSSSRGRPRAAAQANLIPSTAGRLGQPRHLAVQPTARSRVGVAPSIRRRRTEAGRLEGAAHAGRVVRKQKGRVAALLHQIRCSLGHEHRASCGTERRAHRLSELEAKRRKVREPAQRNSAGRRRRKRRVVVVRQHRVSSGAHLRVEREARPRADGGRREGYVHVCAGGVNLAHIRLQYAVGPRGADIAIPRRHTSNVARAIAHRLVVGATGRREQRRASWAVDDFSRGGVRIRIALALGGGHSLQQPCSIDATTFSGGGAGGGVGGGGGGAARQHSPGLEEQRPPTHDEYGPAKRNPLGQFHVVNAEHSPAEQPPPLQFEQLIGCRTAPWVLPVDAVAVQRPWRPKAALSGLVLAGEAAADRRPCIMVVARWAIPSSEGRTAEAAASIAIAVVAVDASPPVCQRRVIAASRIAAAARRGGVKAAVLVADMR
eukprot:scaffold21511_cov133-Isochrysis_galbana.AAC.5